MYSRRWIRKYDGLMWQEEGLSSRISRKDPLANQFVLVIAFNGVAYYERLHLASLRHARERVGGAVHDSPPA